MSSSAMIRSARSLRLACLESRRRIRPFSGKLIARSTTPRRSLSGCGTSSRWTREKSREPFVPGWSILRTAGDPATPSNGEFKRNHPDLDPFITSALAQELQNASPKDHENKPRLWKDARANAEWDHTLRNEKFAQFLAGRQIDRTNLSAEKKTESKQVLGNLVKRPPIAGRQSNVWRQERKRLTAEKTVLDREYSRRLSVTTRQRASFSRRRISIATTPELNIFATALSQWQPAP